MEGYLSLRNLGKHLGSGALSGKMLLAMVIKNNKIDAYFREGKVK